MLQLLGKNIAHLFFSLKKQEVAMQTGDIG